VGPRDDRNFRGREKYLAHDANLIQYGHITNIYYMSDTLKKHKILPLSNAAKTTV